MIRIGVHSLQRALEGAGFDRDPEASLKRHLARLEAARVPPAGTASAPGAVREPEPLSDLFLALCESVASTYLDQKRPQAAPEIVWEAFAARPRLPEYRALRTWAQKAGTWPAWREKAWACLDERGDDAVAILIWEGHLEEAWARAQRHGAREDEWMELARRREQDHPAEAYDLYRGRVEQLLARTDLGAYRETVRWLRRMESLKGVLGREADFAAFVDSVRGRSSRRPRLVRLLGESLGPDAFPERRDGDEAP